MKPITSQKELDAFCKRAASEPYLTVDTEFMREKTYYPILCLIQVATSEEAIAIDPMADIDLSALLEIFKDQTILKVFHAARQDLEIFYHMMGEVPAPVFDSQVAAMVCGFGDQVGYETLVNKIAGAELDKSSRFTDWARRPLTDKQITYALGDVTHLRVIYEKLRDQLEETGRIEWLNEEMAILADPSTYVTNPEDAYQRIKARTLKPKFLNMLRELAAWRETEAIRKDVPRNRIIRDDALLNIAAHPPKQISDLAHIRGFSKEMAHGRFGQAIMKVCQEAEAIPVDDWPRPPKKRKGPPPPGTEAVMELLKVLLKAKAAEHHVAPRMIASSTDLEAIATEDSPDILTLKGWRNKIFGQDALALKEGKLAFCIRNHKIEMVDI